MKRLISLVMLAVMLVVPAFSVYGAEELVLRLAVSGMTVVDDTLYLADSFNRSVWQVTDGKAELLAGQTDITDLSGQPVEGYRDGDFDEASFSEPWAIVPYLDGLLVSDTGNHVLRYLDLEAGKVYTAAGTGKAGYRDGSRASFQSPTGLAVGDDGTVYIADTGNHAIRAMDSDGKVTTLAGGEEGCALGSLEEARFSEPTGLCWADGVLYVADSGNHRIVAISDDQVTLVAGATLTGDGAYEGGYRDGSAEQALFSSPQGVAVDAEGNVYVADTGNGAVRKIENGTVYTLASMEDSSTYPVSPRGLWLDGEKLYVGDVFANTLFCCNVYPSGWQQLNGVWYYYDADGVMETGWVMDDGKWYYLDASGVMETGWVLDNGTWYYLDASGAMKIGWVQVNGKWYYFYPSGAMAADTMVDGYTLGSDGEME